jgi:hypothetical protein
MGRRGLRFAQGKSRSCISAVLLGQPLASAGSGVAECGFCPAQNGASLGNDPHVHDSPEHREFANPACTLANHDHHNKKPRHDPKIMTGH